MASRPLTAEDLLAVSTAAAIRKQAENERLTQLCREACFKMLSKELPARASAAAKDGQCDVRFRVPSVSVSFLNLCVFDRSTMQSYATEVANRVIPGVKVSVFESTGEWADDDLNAELEW